MNFNCPSLTEIKCESEVQEDPLIGQIDEFGRKRQKNGEKKPENK